MGGVGLLSHPSWVALAPQLGRLGSETRVWDVQGGSVERARVAYVAALKVGLVFGGRGDRAGGRGESCSTRGHCGLAAWPRNAALRRGNKRLFPKAFSKRKPHSAVAAPRTLLRQVMLLSIPLCPPRARGACPARGTLALAEREGVSLYPGLNLVSTVHCREPQSRWRP